MKETILNTLTKRTDTVTMGPSDYMLLLGVDPEKWDVLFVNLVAILYGRFVKTHWKPHSIIIRICFSIGLVLVIWRERLKTLQPDLGNK